MRKKIFFKALLILYLGAGVSSASERHFTFSYESPVLQDGQKELETYSDFRFGRDLYYSALDERLELEMGLGGGVQTSLYLNFTQEMADDGAGNINTGLLADGIANEWKFKLLDNVTDDIGLGLYVENGFKPDEYELETKVILDKQTGEWLATFNLTNEPEFHYIDRTGGYSIIPSLGIGYFLIPERFFLGVEAQNRNFWYDTSKPITTSILSAGPVLSYSAENWWTTLTFLPQIVNFQGPSLDFTESQRFQIQLALSISLGGMPAQNKVTLPIPTEQDAERSSQSLHPMSLKDLAGGRELYANSCQKCHQLHSPSEFSEAGWERILEKMRHKANLDEKAENSISGYLKVFSKNRME